MKLEQGKLVAGKWRVITELYSDDFPRYRVTDSEGRIAEMLIIDDARLVQENLNHVKDLRHDNLVQVYESGKWLETNYYVRELIAMESLAEWYERQKPLEEDQAVAIACQLALVLQTLESTELRRCSFNPDNVFITGDGLVKIDPLEQFFRREKNSRFASPDENPADISDARADIYRTGLLTGWLLLKDRFDGDSKQVLQFLRTETESALISDPLRHVLRKMTSGKAGDRHMSAEEMLDDLDRVLAISSHRRVFGDDPESEPQWYEDKRFWLYSSLFLFAFVFVLIIIKEVLFK